MASDPVSNTTIRRPPKRNLVEAIKILEHEAEQCRSAAIKHQNFADNPLRPGTNTAYWQKSATAAIRKAERIGLVTEWLERSYVE